MGFAYKYLVILLCGILLDVICRTTEARSYNRVKRFLVDSHSQNDVYYATTTLCYHCSDFNSSTKCDSRHAIEDRTEICFGKFCSISATYINGKFYLENGCVSRDICLAENERTRRNQECENLSNISNGTKCTYCCQGRDHLCYDDMSFTIDCIVQANRLSHQIGRDNQGIYNPIDERAIVDRICKFGKPFNSYPGNPTKYIQCGDGQHFILNCPATLVWNNQLQTCSRDSGQSNACINQPTADTSSTKLTSPVVSTKSTSSSSTITTKSPEPSSPSSTSQSPTATSKIATQTNTTSISSSVSATTQSFSTSQEITLPNIETGILACETCTSGKDCKTVQCLNSDVYCLNVIEIDQTGNKTVIKKGCASSYECKFDHSHKNSACDPEVMSSTFPSTPSVCQYCCLATPNMSTPCNVNNVPDKLDWFGEASSAVSLTTNVSLPSTMSSGNKTFSTTHHSSFASTKSLQTSTQNYSSTIVSTQHSVTTSSSARTTVTAGLNNTLSSSSGAPIVVSSTKSPPYTIPPRTITCNVCFGPENICEKLFVPQSCAPPNNYCLNIIQNKKDGTRLVNRRCGDFTTCYRDWFVGSSDVDKCRKFDERYILTLDFQCTFCCITDNCNLPLKPSDETLYKDIL